MADSRIKNQGLQAADMNIDSKHAPLRAVTGVTAVLTALMGIIMLAGMVRYPDKGKFHDNEISSPVLAMELARNRTDLEEVLQTQHPHQAAIKDSDSLNAYRAVSALYANTIEDCGFIPLYSLFLLPMILLFTGTSAKNKIRVAARILIGAVAVLDYAENYGIFKTLHASIVTDELAHAIRYPSLGKWALLGVTLLVLGSVMVTSHKDVLSESVRTVLGIGFAITGVLLLMGMLCPMWIGNANLLFSLLIIASATGLLAPFFRISLVLDR